MTTATTTAAVITATSTAPAVATTVPAPVVAVTISHMSPVATVMEALKLKHEQNIEVGRRVGG